MTTGETLETCLHQLVPPQVDSTHQRILDLMVRSEAMQRQRESGNIRNVTWRSCQGYAQGCAADAPAVQPKMG